MFGCYKQIVYLCTVFKINTAPKILKKRELGKFMNLKNNNRSPARSRGKRSSTSHPCQLKPRMTARKDGQTGN